MKLWRGLLGALAVGLLLGTLVAASGDEGDGYRVRAVFDNASFVIPGEDVKVAGVKVGKIDDVDLTRDNKAAVVLLIDDPAFQPFRRDAHCQIRLQSLIGEQYVECEPTRPHKSGTPLAKPLPEIESGPGEGQHLLPVDNNTTPVAVDLINDIYRLPAARGLAAHHQRARRRPRGQRAAPARRREAGEPRAEGVRPGDRHPRRPGPAPGAARGGVRRGAEALGRPAQGDRGVHRPRGRDRGRSGGAWRGHRAQLPEAPAVPARAAAHGRPPRRVRGADDAGAEQPGREGAGHQRDGRAARPVRGRRHACRHEPRRLRGAGAERLPRDPPADQRPPRAVPAAAAALRRPRGPVHELRRLGRRRGAHAADLLLHERRERRGRGRPLRALRAQPQRLRPRRQRRWAAASPTSTRPPALRPSAAHVRDPEVILDYLLGPEEADR